MPLADEPVKDFEPRRPALVALGIYLLAALTLCWPMLTGQFLVGRWSDQYEAGYSFRHFAAEYFRAHHAIPQWNPYLFGGLPFIGAAHGDIFYPTAWLRWIVPTDVAMNLGFAIHIVLAGLALYGLMRALKVSWQGAVVAGLSYELTGIVISLVHPGHDGKLFVSALAPFLLMGIVRAVRDREIAGYGIIALATGLSLQGHPQASYYLLVAGAVWGLFWVFGPEGPKGPARFPVIAGAAGAVLLGVGLYAVYALPMKAYVPYSPRAEGGFNSGWEYAQQFALPPSELLGLLLPRIDGGTTPQYFGANGLKLHTEYLGPVVLMLSVLGIGGAERKRVRVALGTIAGLFLLVSLGGATPFFRLWYAVMPLMNRLRAPGMAFFLVSLPIAAFAGFGAERLFRGEAKLNRVWMVAGLAGFLGILGLVGVLQTVAEDIARSAGFQGGIEAAIANAPALRLDAIRLLAVTAVAAGVIWAIGQRRLPGWGGLGALLVVVAVDGWLVGRDYFEFSPGAKTTYASDEIMRKLEATPLPYRVYTPGGSLDGLSPYPRSWLMSAHIPVLFGYHGNELRAFDDLLGGKNAWKNQLNPNLWKMFAIRYIVLTQAQDVPGYHQILGPVATRFGTGILMEADTIPPYARVMAGAATVPEDQLVATASDPRFPFDRLAIYPDTAGVKPEQLNGQIPAPSTLSAKVGRWEPGRFEVTIEGTSAKPEYLVVAENWYPDWHATVDGKPAKVLRAQNTLLSAVVPPGAHEVVFWFDSPAYHEGKLISLGSLVGVLALFAAPLMRRRAASDG